uniref:Uncharacterized protein n=2 Tax=viral metagenome TaxID=1070528 RepID=A0A6H1ZTC6_9ZZZZ
MANTNSKRQEIEDVLIAQISEAENVGPLYLGHVSVRRPEDFLALMIEKSRQQGEPDKIKGWEFYRDSVVDERGAVATNHVRRTHHYILRGVYGHDEEHGSEREFNAIVDNVLDVVSGIVRINPYMHRHLAVEALLDIDMIQEVLVHTAEVTIQFEEDLIIP